MICFHVTQVKLGLCNGARGIVRGLKYTTTAETRRLEFALVEFPSYRGEPFFPEQPKLVPVPVEAVKARTKPFLMAGLPLRLCYAVTIHKAQGMTVPEGVVIDWKSKMPLASLVGLPFVAMTRAQTVTKVAVKNLPEYVNFLQPRDSKQFKFRKLSWADHQCAWACSHGFKGKGKARWVVRVVWCT